jgi:hypothetical protein
VHPHERQDVAILSNICSPEDGLHVLDIRTHYARFSDITEKRPSEVFHPRDRRDFTLRRPQEGEDTFRVRIATFTSTLDNAPARLSQYAINVSPSEESPGPRRISPRRLPAMYCCFEIASNLNRM